MPNPLTRGKNNQRGSTTKLLVPMLVALLLIAGFQVYWVHDNYRKQRQELEGRTSLLFRDMLRGLQDSVLDLRLSLAKNDSAVLQQGQAVALVRPTGDGTILPGSGAKIKSTIRFRSVDDSNSRKGVVNILRIAGYRDSAKRQVDTAFFMSRPGGTTQWRPVSDSILSAIDPDNIESIHVNKFSDSSVRIKGNPVTGGVVHITMKDKEAVSSPPRRTSAPSVQRRAFNTITLNNDEGQKVVIRLDSVLAEKIPESLIRSGFAAVLARERIAVPFSITESGTEKPAGHPVDFRENTGLYQGYDLHLGNAFSYLVRRVRGPILFSILLVTLTVFSFAILYRSLLRQSRLSQMRNDLVSNITHELKTPIATVGVAIEALKNFNAIHDTKRTEEYLDISKQELQRLGLLVDKVLKLSMFETEHIRISREGVNLGTIVKEVSDALRLQLEKQEALLTTETVGDLGLSGDYHHLTSVVFNLIDNALKYSKGKPEIHISVADEGQQVRLSVSDKGIGIPSAYRTKVFEKFFRVPQGDTHNAKGHGLGLSYVAGVVRQHGGSIELESRDGEGSRFTIILPKDQ